MIRVKSQDAKALDTHDKFILNNDDVSANALNVEPTYCSHKQRMWYYCGRHTCKYRLSLCQHLTVMSIMHALMCFCASVCLVCTHTRTLVDL